MINLSFHLENIFSCWTHMTPFLMQVSEPRGLGLGPGDECSVLSVLCPASLSPGAGTRCREKSSSVKALAPSPACEASEGSLWSVARSAPAS